MLETLRSAGPAILAVATAVAIDRATARRGLTPPGFRRPRRSGPDGGAAAAGSLAGILDGAGVWPGLRRAIALGALSLVLWLGVYLPLGMVGVSQEVDPARLAPSHLFTLHAVFAAGLGVWLLLGFGVVPARWVRQIGLSARRLPRELALGVACGVVGWMGVLGVLIALGYMLFLLGGPELVPSEPPPVIPWLAGLPLGVRLAVSLSAGVVEESFFRGFLQPRTGVPLSTVLFVLAHLSYEQPLMLIGITLLSLLFAFLVHWRRNVWAAIVAHATFDALQLGVVIPWAMRLMGGDGPPLPVALPGL